MALQLEEGRHGQTLILMTMDKLKKKQLPCALAKKNLLDFDFDLILIEKDL